MTNWIEKYQAGKIFLQPNSSKLPSGYKIPYKDRSSELAISIGGENGEPAYLIPSFKYGIPLSNPIKEFNKTGEHLGGPFKTWQEADKWEREIRHPYVEKEQAIPTPIRTWGKGVVPSLQEGKEIKRTIPEITVYGKKNYLQELDKQQQKYLADMAKYKQDSAEWAILNNKYKDAKKAYEDSLKLHNWTQLYKEADFNRPVFEIWTNDEALDYIATTGDRNRADVEKIGFLGTPFLNPKRDTNPNDYNNYYGGVGHTWGTKDIPSKYFEDITEENKKIIGLFKKQKIKPSHFINTDNPDSNDTGSLYPIYDKPKGQLPVSPIAPAKPTGTNIKYDSTYENLRMRSLWATMAKQDTTSKIGTLNPLDPLYEKGFTYREAQKFPEEIRKQYKLDYPIYEKGGTIPKAQEGVKIQADRRNWLQRTNDKIQTTYNKNKPQLLKDFPLLDLPGMMVEYVTGHSENPDAGLAMVNPVGKVRVKTDQVDDIIKKLGSIGVIKRPLPNLVTVAKTAKQNMLDYIEDPAILQTAAKNTALGKRLGIRSPGFFEEGKFVPKTITEYRRINASNPTTIGWGKDLPVTVGGTHHLEILEPPAKNIGRIKANFKKYGFLSSADNVLNKKIDDELLGTLEHEFGHHARIGNTPIEQLKAEKLLKTQGELKSVAEKHSELNLFDNSDVFYLDVPGELSMNLRDLAKELKIPVNYPYIGYEKMQPIWQYNGPKRFVLDALKLQTKRDYKRVWDALTGKYLTIPTGIVGSSIYMNNQNKDKE